MMQGSKEKRLTGDEHMQVVQEFCEAAVHCFPNCLIQFEDFQTNQAFAILEQMRDKFLCFNDDIQGTGGVVTAGYGHCCTKLRSTNTRGLCGIFVCMLHVSVTRMAVLC